MSTTTKRQRLKAPLGEAKWAHLLTPKEGFKDPSTGKPKGPPKFMIDVYFDPDNDPAAKAWLKQLRADVDALPVQTQKNPRTGKQEPMEKHLPIKVELGPNDEPTRRVYCSFSTGEDYKPGLFDKWGRALNVKVGNGSKVIVNYTPWVYEGFGGGITLYLNAVQVMELVEYQPQTAAAYGFEVSDEPPPPLPEDSQADADARWDETRRGSGFDNGNLTGNSKAGTPPPEDDLPF